MKYHNIRIDCVTGNGHTSACRTKSAVIFPGDTKPDLDSWWSEINGYTTHSSLNNNINFLYAGTDYVYKLQGAVEFYDMAICKGFASFSTQIIPTEAAFGNCYLILHCTEVTGVSTPYPDIVIQKGDFSDRTLFEADDWDRNRWTGNYGSKSIVDCRGSEFTIKIDPDLINPEAYTNICITDSVYLDGVRPDSGANKLRFEYFSQGISPALLLEVGGWDIVTKQSSDLTPLSFMANATLENQTNGTFTQRGFQVANDRFYPENNIISSWYEDDEWQGGNYNHKFEYAAEIDKENTVYRAYGRFLDAYYYGEWIGLDDDKIITLKAERNRPSVAVKLYGEIA